MIIVSLQLIQLPPEVVAGQIGPPGPHPLPQPPLNDVIQTWWTVSYPLTHKLSPHWV